MEKSSQIHAPVNLAPWRVHPYPLNKSLRGPQSLSGLPYNKSQRDARFHKFTLVKNSTRFGQIYCTSSGVSTLYTQQ